ncbi:MAG: transcription elongation GreA/GreB family factor, partial [Myxococcota bacterium]
GGALIGRSEGEEVTVPAPGGKQAWEIVEVRYE